MAIDPALAVSRRIGLGLAPGESIPSDVRSWAVRQLHAVPPLDFIGPDGTSLASTLGPDAKPFEDFGAASVVWEKFMTTEDELNVKARGLQPDQ